MIAVSLTAIWFIISRYISAPLKLTVNMLKDVAEGEGDLTKRLKADSSDEIGELSRWFNTFMDKLQGIIRQIAGNAQMLAGLRRNYHQQRLKCPMALMT